MAKKKLTLAHINEKLENHFKDDVIQFSELHKKLDGLATQEDTKQIMQAINAVKTSSVVIRFGWKTFVIIGTTATVILAITGAWKAVVTALFVTHIVK